VFGEVFIGDTSGCLRRERARPELVPLARQAGSGPESLSGFAYDSWHDTVIRSSSVVTPEKRSDDRHLPITIAHMS
jgi:hypothetical protein